MSYDETHKNELGLGCVILLSIDRVGPRRGHGITSNMLGL